jgi:hypothetical protein
VDPLPAIQRDLANRRRLRFVVENIVGHICKDVKSATVSIAGGSGADT